MKGNHWTSYERRDVAIAISGPEGKKEVNTYDGISQSNASWGPISWKYRVKGPINAVSVIVKGQQTHYPKSSFIYPQSSHL